MCNMIYFRICKKSGARVKISAPELNDVNTQGAKKSKSGDRINGLV